MKLSILIPSLHNRTGCRENLLSELDVQVEHKTTDVEILLAIDGGQLSVGEKRNKLLHAASGDYVAFVDDDDGVSNNYIDELLFSIDQNKTLGRPPPDVITFEVEFTDVSQRSRTLFVQSLKYRDEKIELGRQKVGAPPTHIACWRREVALCNEFPPISYAEDWLWWQPLLQSGLVKTEIHIDWPLYHYRFNRLVTGTQKREKREEALKWAGPEGVNFYWYQNRIVSERKPLMIPNPECELICTCHIT